MLQSPLHMHSEEKGLCSKILAVLINTMCELLIDRGVAEHTVRQLQITQTVDTTQIINCGDISKCDPGTVLALKHELDNKLKRDKAGSLSPAFAPQDATAY